MIITLSSFFEIDSVTPRSLPSEVNRRENKSRYGCLIGFVPSFAAEIGASFLFKETNGYFVLKKNRQVSKRQPFVTDEKNGTVFAK
ncbi:hypothetical protein GFC29_2506 [Anoxybacillus sp. B7M1]|jgi:hypothetical protein|nr:hypothetical protein GFC28_2929 [Anoxybacillus sp. B2M1]ANB63945.1 hypothetical protein GFC29_2506 [Anoxybacillus sp. B7M1]